MTENIGRSSAGDWFLLREAGEGPPKAVEGE
jgi:hypothetical protein